jgi:hypothetical protein
MWVMGIPGLIILGLILYATLSGIQKSMDESTEGEVQDDGEFF